MSTKLFILRHGDIDSNRKLTPEGEEKAIEKGREIINSIGEKFSQEVFLIISSPMERAFKTAKKILNECE